MSNNFNIFDTLRKLSTKQELSITEKRINQKAIENAKKNGYNATAQFNFELRDVYRPENIKNEYTPTKTLPFVYKHDDVKYLTDKMQVIQNANSSFKYPFVSYNGMQWGYASYNDDCIIESKPLQAHRIFGKLEISLDTILSNGDNLQQNFVDAMMLAMYEKVIRQMFSTQHITSDVPQSLISGIEQTTITDANTLIDMQSNVDNNCNNAVWLISPSAKKHLNVINSTQNIFSDGKLLGNDFIYSNLIEDGKIVYIDLSKVVLANFGAIGITIDNFTQKTNGKNVIVVEAYFDFAIASDDYISVGKFES